MFTTKHEIIAMQEAAKPLMKWMNENCHPHCTLIVKTESIEWTEMIAKVEPDNKEGCEMEEQQGQIFNIEIPPEPLPKYKCRKCRRDAAVVYDSERYIWVCPFCGFLDPVRTRDEKRI